MSSYGMEVPSPAEEDYHQAWLTQRLEQSRRQLDPSDVLAELQHLLLEIDDDHQHPLWPLVKHCTREGTLTETGVSPHMAPLVGEALLPHLDKAITRLVGERLDDFSAWED